MPSQKNDYIIDINSAAETARLIDQHVLITQAMGGLFPEAPDLTTVTRVLDLACGPGVWVTEVALRHPEIEVVGIDLSRTMIEYARARAKVQARDNAVFEVMDLRQPLAFPAGSFELVNARFLVGVLDREHWPRLLAECVRVLVPGGLLRLTECEIGVSNCPAVERFNAALCQALYRDGRTFSLDGRTLGILHMLGKLLQDAGCVGLGQRPFVLDASAGTPLYDPCREDYEVTCALLQPYLQASGQFDDTSFEALYRELIEQLRDPDVRALTFGLTVWGSTPTQ